MTIRKEWPNAGSPMGNLGLALVQLWTGNQGLMSTEVPTESQVLETGWLTQGLEERFLSATYKL